MTIEKKLRKTWNYKSKMPRKQHNKASKMATNKQNSLI